MFKKHAFSFLVCGLSLVIIVVSLQVRDTSAYFQQSFEHGLVHTVISEDLQEDPYIPGRFVGRQKIDIELLSGEKAGERYTITNTLSRGHNILAEAGGRYLFTLRQRSDGVEVVWLYNYNRAIWLAVLLVLFVLVLLLIAGLKGLQSLIALFFTGTILLFVLIPLLLKGVDPIGISVFLLSLIVCVSFFLLSGWSRKSFAAIAGTIGGVLAAGAVTLLFSRLMRLSGINLEKGEEMLYIAKDFGIRIHGFLFISIMIASLGAVMDVAMGIASSLEELKRHRPDLDSRSLFRSGMAIGRDLIGTMVNTLILAFAGGSFTLIMMIFGLSMSFRQLINIPLIGIEIVQGLSGSIGIIMTVPLSIVATIFFINKGGKDVEK